MKAAHHLSKRKTNITRLTYAEIHIYNFRGFADISKLSQKSCSKLAFSIFR